MIRKSTADRFLTAEELDRFLARVARLRSRQVAAGLLIMLNLGLRVGELVGLRLADVSPQGRSLVVDTLKRKVPVRHTLELPEALARIVRAQVARATVRRSPWLFPSPADPSRPLSRRAFQRTFARIRSAAGLSSRATCHSLRHTRAMMVYRASGFDTAQVAHDLRHASRKSADQYVHADPELYRQTARKIPTLV